jgi:hypothetical protein
MTEPDLTMLALGTDLTGLGLNLNAPDSLYKVGSCCCEHLGVSPSCEKVMALSKYDLFFP